MNLEKIGMDRIVLAVYMDNVLPRTNNVLLKEQVWKVAFTQHLLETGSI